MRWTQTTQLSRLMAGPVLPHLPTALQLNRAPIALSLAGRLSRRDDGGWWSGGLLELVRPTVRTPITITAPIPCTYTPSYSQSPTRRGAGPPVSPGLLPLGRLVRIIQLGPITIL